MVSALQEEAITAGLVPSPHNVPKNSLTQDYHVKSHKSSPRRIRRGSLAHPVFSVQDEFLNSPIMKLRRGILVVMATKRFFYIFKEKRNALKLRMQTGHELGAVTTSLSISPGTTGATGDRRTDPFYDWMVSYLYFRYECCSLI